MFDTLVACGLNWLLNSVECRIVKYVMIRRMRLFYMQNILNRVESPDLPLIKSWKFHVRKGQGNQNWFRFIYR